MVFRRVRKQAANGWRTISRVRKWTLSGGRHRPSDRLSGVSNPRPLLRFRHPKTVKVVYESGDYHSNVPCRPSAKIRP